MDRRYRCDSSLKLGSGEADLGGALVSIDNATVRELAENNIFRKMTRADINTMLNTLVPRSMLNTLYRFLSMRVTNQYSFRMMLRAFIFLLEMSPYPPL